MATNAHAWSFGSVIIFFSLIPLKHQKELYSTELICLFQNRLQFTDVCKIIRDLICK